MIVIYSAVHIHCSNKESGAKKSVLNCAASAAEGGTSRYATRLHSAADLLSRSSDHRLCFPSALRRLLNVKLLWGAADALEFSSAGCGIFTCSRAQLMYLKAMEDKSALGR
jgi:hypothetical protein